VSSKKPIVTSGYEVDSKKLAIVEKKIRTLLWMEFGTDEASDANVEFILIDRQRFQRMLFRPVPYSFVDGDGSFVDGQEIGKDVAARENAHLRAMVAAQFNLSIAHSDFVTEFRVWRDHR